MIDHSPPFQTWKFLELQPNDSLDILQTRACVIVVLDAHTQKCLWSNGFWDPNTDRGRDILATLQGRSAHERLAQKVFFVYEQNDMMHSVVLKNAPGLLRAAVNTPEICKDLLDKAHPKRQETLAHMLTMWTTRVLPNIPKPKAA